MGLPRGQGASDFLSLHPGKASGMEKQSDVLEQWRGTCLRPDLGQPVWGQGKGRGKQYEQNKSLL